MFEGLCHKLILVRDQQYDAHTLRAEIEYAYSIGEINNREYDTLIESLVRRKSIRCAHW